MVIIITDYELYLLNGYYENMIENRISIVMGIKRIDKREMTKLTGLDRHTLNSLYNGKTNGIKFDTLNKLCFALDCTPNDLFRYIPD